MSTILKALRRLEQDKAAETDRPLQNAVVEGGVAPASAAPSRVRRLAIVLAGVALGAGGVLWLQGGSEPPPATLSPPPVAAAPPPRPVPPAPVAPPAPIPAAPSAPVPPDPLAVAPPAAEIAPGAEASSVPAPVGEGLTVSVGAVEPSAVPPAPEVASAPPPAGPVAVAPPADPAPRLESFPAPPAEPAPKRLARVEPPQTAPRAELPVRAESAVSGAVVGGSVGRSGEEAPLGEDVRAAPQPRRRAARAPAAPDVAVVRTVWHPKPERRTALLAAPDDPAPREYREGDRVGALTLLRIEPSGVVFERDGVEIRQRIGGSAAN